ncbi:unnamed protein product, partial [marine sediment metagenome]
GEEVMEEFGGMTKGQYKKFMDDYKRFPKLVESLHRIIGKVNKITGLDWSRVIDWEKLSEGMKGRT